MVAIRCTSLLLASAALLSSYVNAYGQIAQVVDANNFCVFLPPADSVDRGISETEWNAEAFCIGKTPLATNAGKLHSGFIQSAHFLETEKYVQVTGKISPTVERLNATDEGGQYDIKAPKGSSCAGWKFYVNLVEPSQNTYCMRCCVSTFFFQLVFKSQITHLFIFSFYFRTMIEVVTVVSLKRVALILFQVTIVDLAQDPKLLPPKRSLPLPLPKNPPPPPPLPPKNPPPLLPLLLM